ncbi:hypothetical protein JJL45_12590 [Tamlana sp. s12]|uniref:hypothetical protein n=1 Tax=Tamlana sp. s12 TaxID=1630406 RepID=UPI000801EF0D|nr:hypothetical protein [Tamlana sp. s12]OBQ56609.1 hypothetical protein VQ01_04505 [Tamlana sp. s12]QQY81753.1 hypothetical protein JJL45_12590 [Tamlana sp. s12]
MIDFLINNNRLFIVAVEIIAAVIGGIVYNFYKPTAAKFFVFFLFYIVILEVIGFYTILVVPNNILSFIIGTNFEKNHWFYTITWDIGAVLFYVYYFKKILVTQIFKSIISIAGICFLVFSISYIIVNNDMFFTEFYDSIVVFGALIIVLCTSLYFIEILKSDKILFFYKDLNFYISITIFLWWIVVTPLTFYDVYFVYEVGSHNRDKEFFILRQSIYIIANLFMYGMFTFALIYCRPRKKEIADCK